MYQYRANNNNMASSFSFSFFKKMFSFTKYIQLKLVEIKMPIY